MQFNIDREIFLKGIQRMLSVTETDAMVPILSNVLIRTGKGEVTVTATDREIGLVADYAAEVVAEGGIALPARKLFEMVRALPPGTVNFKKKRASDRVGITGGKAVFGLSGVSADDFPEVAVDKDTVFFALKDATVAWLIDRTSFAMSRDDTKTSLRGVFFETEKAGDGHRMRMVATDGHRLSVAEAYAEGGLELEKGAIVPSKGISEIRKFVAGNGHTEVGVTDGFCVLKKGGAVLKVTLLLAEFPDYRKVIPDGAGNGIRLDRGLFLLALRRMDVVSSDTYTGVRLRLAENRMELESANPDVGEAGEEMEVSYGGKVIEVEYDVKYLIDAVQAASGNEILFEMRDGMKPGVIREAESDGYTCVIMPLRM